MISTSYKILMKKFTAPITSLVILSGMAIAPNAAAQIRVDARVHASSTSCAQCDLSNKRLNGVVLKDVNFAGALFNNSNLSGGEFDGSDLRGAHFRKALLYRINGDKVEMENAVFEDATLTEAKVSNSNLRLANLRRADLSRAEFHGNDFTGSNLISVKAPAVDFTGSNFQNARLDHMNLSEAKLDDAKLNGVTFGYAVLSGTSLDGANLSDAKLTNVQGLQQAQLDVACGNMNTELPDGLSVPYCEDTRHVMDEGHDHAALSPEMLKTVKRLERAISDVEIILDATPNSNRPLKRKLQSIHADLVQSKRAIEQ